VTVSQPGPCLRANGAQVINHSATSKHHDLIAGPGPAGARRCTRLQSDSGGGGRGGSVPAACHGRPEGRRNKATTYYQSPGQPEAPLATSNHLVRGTSLSVLEARYGAASAAGCAAARRRRRIENAFRS
jgi:hypothetical protein